MKNYKLNKNIFWIIFSLSIFTGKSAHAFIPYPYNPNQNVLINTSIGIALTSNQYLKYGFNKNAIGLSKLAVSLNPKEVELWMLLANAQINNDQLDEALISTNKAKIIDPNLASIWFTEANIEIRRGKIDSAISSIKTSLNIDNKNANSYFLLGNARLMQKKYNVSLNAFTKAIKINPKFWQAINNQGLIYYEIGKENLAIETWRKGLKIKPDPETKLALAIALYSIKPNNDESIPLAKEALEENPNYFFEGHQAEQLWGEKLIAAGVNLFKNPKLKAVINTASANSNFTN